MTHFSHTKLYRDQHGRLRELAGKMLSATTEAEHRALLAQLAGQVKMHLKGEDDVLYPRLLAHEDAAVRTKAKQLQQSMGELATVFQSFYATWIKAGAIAGDLPGYTVAMHGVVGALAKRMDLEDHDLYDLADRVFATA